MQRRTSAARIYALTSPLCVVAPALVPPSAFDPTVALTHVAFGGLPMCGLAVLLATIHSQHQLEGWTYRWIASIWAAAALLAFVPLGAWVGPHVDWDTSLGLRAVVMVCAALSLIVLAVRVWRLPTNVRTVLAAGIALVGLLFAAFSLHVLRPWLLEEPTGLAMEARGLANVFLNASITCLVLLSAVVLHRVQREPRLRIRLSLLLPVFNLIAWLLFVLATEPAWPEYLAHLDAARSRPGGDGGYSDIWGMLACRQLNNWGPIHGGERLGVIVMEVVNLAPLIGTGFVHGFALDASRGRILACEWSWWLGGVFLLFSTVQWVLVGLVLDRRFKTGQPSSRQC
jgi:hypothetical protein